MRTRGPVIAFKMAILATIAIAAFGGAVLYLWNWLMPVVFGLHAITFWQALGLVALSWILFGGLRGFHGGPGRHMYWRRRMMERWEQMTPEERDKFRQTMRGRCGPFGEPAERKA